MGSLISRNKITPENIETENGPRKCNVSGYLGMEDKIGV
jgi:hypothetical protein